MSVFLNLDEFLNSMEADYGLTDKARSLVRDSVSTDVKSTDSKRSRVSFLTIAFFFSDSGNPWR